MTTEISKAKTPKFNQAMRSYRKAVVGLIGPNKITFTGAKKDALITSLNRWFLESEIECKKNMITIFHGKKLFDAVAENVNPILIQALEVGVNATRLLSEPGQCKIHINSIAHEGERGNAIIYIFEAPQPYKNAKTIAEFLTALKQQLQQEQDLRVAGLGGGKRR